jgi:hypothetical protein
MNSQDGALCGAIGGEKVCVREGGASWDGGGRFGAEVGGCSGEEGRVDESDQNEGTGEDGDANGAGSHSVIAIDGMLPAEKLPRSRSLSGL